jgi:hypothetical protein
MPAADAIAPGAKVLDEGDGTAPAVHGLLGHEGKSYKFHTQAFGVGHDSLPHSSGPALLITEVEQWANESDPGRRLYDWLIEPTGSVADTIAREERHGFLARLAAVGFNAKRLEVQRRTLPPGLGHSSVGGVIHFDAKGTALDDAVVLFSCGPFVGSADLIGRRGCRPSSLRLCRSRPSPIRRPHQQACLLPSASRLPDTRPGRRDG